MDEFAFFMILLGIAVIVSGPVALIIAIVALNKTNRLINKQFQPAKFKPKPLQVELEDEPHQKPQTVIEDPKPAPPAPPEPVLQQPTPVSPVQQPAAGTQPQFTPHKPPKAKEALEQRIGTKWILVAGIITVIFGFGFFLKYAYDNALIGELGRVITAACCGIFALMVGEVARRKDYGIVAKGTSALGFAILYTTIFAAYRHYQLIDSLPAFGLAIALTAVAMIYAVVLNEILIAFLSLLGGFITPVILSTGENLPNSLFGYVLVLSLGAIFCGYYRKWRAINWLCFFGTFGLYTGWFEKFFRDTINFTDGPPQMAIAISWLSVFFIVFLVLPVLYNLIKRIEVYKDDVILIVTNSFIVFYYLTTILYDNHRIPLALSVAGLGVIHLLFMLITRARCPKETNLKVTLLALGLLFITVALPLYYKMYALSVGWALKAVVVTLVGIRFKSRICQLFGFLSIVLCVGNLLYRLPMHTGEFRLFINVPFGTWSLAAAAMLIIYMLYRFSGELQPAERQAVTQLYYIGSIFVFFIAVAMQWFLHCRYNLPDNVLSRIYFMRAITLISAAVWLLLILKPICPKGGVVKVLSMAIALFACCWMLLCMAEIYKEHFMIFANLDFGIAFGFIIALFIAAIIFKRQKQSDADLAFSSAFSLMGIVSLWLLLTMQIYSFWYCRNRYLDPIANWDFIAHMNISVMWAVYAVVLMVLGFIRKKTIHRYIALGLLALLLGKIFLYDTRNLDHIYRITAFLATGITMVGVSYLYQFLKNKGFFENLLT